MLADPPENRFDEEGVPGGLGELADAPGTPPTGDEPDEPPSTLGDSLVFSIDSDEEHLFAGDEVDIDAYYQIASSLANMYDSQEVTGDQYVDFEHRPRDDNDPVFTQPPDWTTESSYLLEVECSTADDYDSVHHLVMANVRANLPPDHDLADDEGYIEYFYAGNAAKSCRQPDNVPPLVVGPDEDLCIRVYFSGPKAEEVRQQVVKRNDALVTKEELQQHHTEVMASMQKELETWVSHG